MTEKKFINLIYYDKYAVVRYKLHDDKFSKLFLIELNDVCNEIKKNNRCSAVIFLSALQNSGIGWDENILNHYEQPSFTPDVSFDSIMAIKIPTIFIMKGKSFSSGFEIALACDIRIGSSDLLACLPESSEGKIPIGGAIERLPMCINQTAALQILLFSIKINAQDAYKFGLVSEVFEPDEVYKKTILFVKKIISNAPLALRLIKESSKNGIGLNLVSGLKAEHDRTLILQDTDDFVEGISSFVNKKSPKFKCK
jgi:enoyl-CoA hydratase